MHCFGLGSPSNELEKCVVQIPPLAEQGEGREKMFVYCLHKIQTFAENACYDWVIMVSVGRSLQVGNPIGMTRAH